MSLHSLGLLKLAHLLDMVHEVTTIDVFHHKIQTVLEGEREKKEREKDTVRHRYNLNTVQMVGLLVTSVYTDTSSGWKMNFPSHSPSH